ncbi:hypothetical protein T4D_8707 [Trichinella pseudospiralis]|uniref:Uncharacterized protein n=1 Tax=Trichinella pseudospiralis TaxID=6337 RepID=A0A0V1FMA5_TRIPS|nr:hypothetical protein T4D_8707 [Trichinella pseudospiralis]
MGSDAARKRPSIPSKFLNSSTTVLKGQPLPESRLTLCNKDKAAIKLTTMNHPPPTHHHDHNCRRRRRRHNNNNNNNNNNNQQQQQQDIWRMFEKHAARNVRRPAFIFQIDRRRRCVTRPTCFISNAGHSSIQAEINMPTAGQLPKNSKFQLPASRVDVIFLVSLSGVFHFSIFATLNNHQQQLAFQQQTGKAVSFGAHIVIFFFPNEHILLGPLATQSTSPMHVVYLSGQQLS